MLSRLWTLAVLTAGIPSQTSSNPEPPLERQNLVVVLVDDLGWHDTSLDLAPGAHPTHGRLHTPHVERLAERGTTFTNGYASAPVCTPTRTSLMTGRAPARSHITYWTLHAGRDTSASFPGLLPPAWRLDGLQEGDVTLAGLLAGAGYRTIHVGKAHLGAVGTSGDDPTRLGFAVNVAGHGAGAPGSYLGTDDFTQTKRQGAEEPKPSVWDVPGLEPYHGEDVYLTEVLVREAKRAVRHAVADDVPFFLHFAPYAVHTPIMANPRLVGRYEDLDPREAAYASMVEGVDAALGELLDLLDELGITDDTLVVFTGDNGGLSAHARGGEPHVHNAPLRSGKGSWYEGGTRVPWVVAGPGVRSGVRSDVPVVTHDLFPTLLAAAGVGVPAQHAATVDGVDLSLLLAEGTEPQERTLLWHQPHFWGVRGPGIAPFTAIRRGRWKLVFRHADRGFELYDLAADLGETDDLAEREPDRVRELAEVMSRALEEAGAQPSVDEGTGEPLAPPRAYAG